MTTTLDHTIVIAALMVTGAIACLFDLRTGRIPNWLTFGAAGLAFAAHLMVAGWSGLGSSLAGWLVGTLVFFPWFALGGMGAGDVKLLAALGAWLGPGGAFWAAVYASLAGGAFALAVTLARGYTRQAFSNLWTLLGYWRVVGPRPLPELTLQSGTGPRLAYAVPITTGALLTLWLR